MDWDWATLNARLVSPLLQIIVLAAVLYFPLLALERVSATVKLKGMVLFVVAVTAAALIAEFLHLHVVVWLLRGLIGLLPVILAIVFMPELRRLLTRLGRLLPTSLASADARILVQIQEAVIYMAQRRIGALIVLERSDKLDDYMEGKTLECDATRDALVTMFWKDTPLHDGAMIIRNGRIAAAGVVLPLTENLKFKDMSGTRHRAGIGISEQTDALAILVSEETGNISVADQGALKSGLSADQLDKVLGQMAGMRRASEL
jgi:diadenylate cyclase